jgi:hypothetical protein
MATYYELFGVERTADERTIRIAYRHRIRLHHPDIAGAQGAQATSTLNEALSVLCDQRRRASYDATLPRPASPGPASHPRPAASSQPPKPPPAPRPVPVPRQERSTSATALLLVGVALMFTCVVMWWTRPQDDSVVGWPLIFGAVAFIVSVSYAVAGKVWSKSFVLNVALILGAPLGATVPTVASFLSGVGPWTLNSAALFAAGSLIVGWHRQGQQKRRG